MTDVYISEAVTTRSRTLISLALVIVSVKSTTTGQLRDKKKVTPIDTYIDENIAALQKHKEYESCTTIFVCDRPSSVKSSVEVDFATN